MPMKTPTSSWLRRSFVISALSAGVIGSFALPHEAIADGQGALAIQIAEKAYKEARENWARIQRQQKTAAAERQKSTDDFQEKWAETWLQRREATKAHQQALTARDTELAKLRRNISDLELDFSFALKRTDSARDALIFVLENLNDVESGRNTELSADVLRSQADEKRIAFSDAQFAQTELMSALEDAQNVLRQRTAELDKQASDLKASIPGQAKIIALEQAYSAQLDGLTKPPIEEDLATLENAEKDAANELLAALLKNPPIYVTGVNVTYDGQPWYLARVAEDTTGEAAPRDSLGQRAYQIAADEVDAELKQVNELLASANRKLRATREDWESASQAESWHDYLVEIRKRDMAVFTLIVESSAVLISAAATGGTATPIVYGFFESLTKAAGLGAKGLSDEAVDVLFKGALHGFTPKALLNLAEEANNTAQGKFWSEIILTGRSGAYELYSGQHATDARNKFSMSDQQSVVIGDIVETLLADGASDVVGLITNSVKSGALASTELGSLGITAGATVTKLIAQAWVDSLNDQSQLIALQAGLEAMMAQRTYLRLVAVRNLIQIKKARLEAVRGALTQLIEHGTKPRQIDVVHDETIVVSKAEKTELWEIHVSFSQPLVYPPTLSGNTSGVTFGEAVKSENGPTEWIFEVASFDPDLEAHSIPFLIELSSNETPHRYLDGDPRTPTRLASLNWHELYDYEYGADRNHQIRLRDAPTGAVLVSMTDMSISSDICSGSRSEQVGEGYLENIDTYYDSNRNQEIAPFAKGEVLQVCMVSNSSVMIPSRDTQGRVRVMGVLDLDTSYSNGYVAPITESVQDSLSRLQENMGTMIDSAPTISIPNLDILP